jgi:hypothetical protein
VFFMFALWALALAALAEVRASQATVPPAVVVWLDRAQAHLGREKRIGSVVSLDVAGSRTRNLGQRPVTEPYQFRLLFPNHFQWRSGDVLHTFSNGVFWQRPRFAEDIRRAAARSLQQNFIESCLRHLARIPPKMAATAEDRGLQDFGWVKGRVISVYSPVDRLRVELVLDPDTARPLATVTHGVVARSDGTTVPNDRIAMLQDYREVAGVRLPHRIEERSQADHAVIVLTRIAVNTLEPGDFLAVAEAGRR